MAEPLDVTKILTGKRVLFAGATGFVGKVSLSMLLHHYGEQLAHVYVLVRKGSSKDANTRFYEKVATSEPFLPVRDRHGGEAEAIAWLKTKCTILDGDITDPWMGMDETRARALKGEIDVVINCAGLVSFNPSLEVGLNVNTHGVKFLVEACLHWDVPLVHMSTSFVAGNRSGLVFEDEEVVGYFPRRHELDGRDFSLEQELKDAEKAVARLREQADDKALTSTFREKALERLKEEGRDWKDEKTLRLAVGRERKLWLTTRLVEAGMERAQHWGWPNTYTYTKSLGEQVIAGTPGLRYALVRPSVVESAQKFPFPGWNEGFTTSAPMIYSCIKGQTALPASATSVLDMIPVDQVAGSLIAITAQALRTPERRVYQQATGDSAPFIANRSVELVGLYKRRRWRNKETGNQFVNSLKSRIEPKPVSKTFFDFTNSPLIGKGAAWLNKTIDENRPTWGAPKFNAALDRVKVQLDDVTEQTSRVNMIVDLFLPFIWSNRFVFRCDNTRSLYVDMPAHDRAKIPWDPEAIDWRTYFLETHIPGLEKWVFPGLDEETQKRKTVHAYRDLLELLDATTHEWRHRVAFRLYEGEESQRFTFGEVHRYAARVGSALLASGVVHQDRVMLVGENRPEWGISFFGILRAGCTAVPVDKEISEAEIVNIARRSEAKICLVSELVLEKHPTLENALAAAGLSTRVMPLAEAMAGDPLAPEGIGAVKKGAAPDDVASLLFTSGTTGNPKGVMLTHRNFAALVAKLGGAFDLGVGDGVLSVLPLHHTFEFSAGFLTPFSRGAEVAYLDELTADRIGDVLEGGNITGLVGVPALWQLFHRKITQEFAAQPKFIEEAMKGLMSINAELRNRQGINLGKLLFWPVHRKFGGNIKFLISGGSALPDDVHKAFHALGFTLDEGYGLTEAAPVLTVTHAGNKRLPGTVGKALPGVELKIFEPDGEGVGEVTARGPNVMAGYFQDRESTAAVLKDGWLFTGDLGRIDGEGNLYLVGRRKDVIIDANGKNVYPDELEELYAVHTHVKELSVVGLPDENGGEKVAALVVPDYKERPREEVRRELEEHFRVVSAEQPFYRRVKVLRFQDADLVRTSSRKVKRPLVVEELKRQEKAVEKAKKDGENTDWLTKVIADVIQKDASDVRADSRLQVDLGFDSLMLTELSAALEARGVPVTAVSDLTKITTVDDLRRVVAQSGRKPAAEVKAREISREVARKKDSELELNLPDGVAEAGRAALSAGQRAIYGGLFDVKVKGKNFIPQNRNFLVVANHASHLDMGLVKVAMGEQGERLVALAARDYFFDSPLKRAYFENFTNLIPMDRSGSLRESLRLAGESLTQGFNLLIFPEGTRSPNGELMEFKPTTGYLALTFGVDILPLYLHGTHNALPKGAWWPKFDELEVRIGPVLELGKLREKVKGLAKSEGYRMLTRMAEESVRALKDGRSVRQEDLSVPAIPTRERRTKAHT
ncbi:MAG: AMP-binding protein [Archangium sp.]|nr:AMP-binding protein [Archangium sp.]MDP3157134.1 AMP-binding protein [Archangium sp.]MDP3575851.1 AMP-binding protein [Archangium sp.]